MSDQRSEATDKQSIPHGEQEIIGLVMQDFVLRSEMGEKKYGEKLRSFNGRIALIDAYQEVIDLAMYLKQELIERLEFSSVMATLKQKVDDAHSVVVSLQSENIALREKVAELEKENEYLKSNARKDWVEKSGCIVDGILTEAVNKKLKEGEEIQSQLSTLQTAFNEMVDYMNLLFETNDINVLPDKRQLTHWKEMVKP